MGTTSVHSAPPFCRFSGGEADGAQQGHVFGTYLHGLFDSGDLTERLAQWLAARKGLTLPERETEDRAAFRQRQYDLLADAVRQNLDMDKIRQIMEKT